MFCRLMVAFDGSEASRRALRAGAELARKLNQPLHSITVVEGVPDYVRATAFEPMDSSVVQLLRDQQQSYVHQLLEEVKTVCEAEGIEGIAEWAIGDEVDEIVNAVRNHQCDLLIVGLRVHPGLVERLLPHTAHILAERAPCSLLGVR